MSTLRWAAVLIAVLLWGCSEQPTVDGGILGPLRLFEPDETPEGVVFLLSDGQGWSRDMRRAAKHLVKRGLIVLGVDTPTALANLALQTEGDGCHHLTGAFETASQAVQKRAAMGVYSLPVLAGVREGAVLALAGLWQSGPETVAGAATVDFQPTLAGAVPLCADPPAEPNADGRSFAYRPPAARLFGWWQAAWTTPPGPAARAFADAAGAEMPKFGSIGPGPKLLAAVLEHADEQRARRADAALRFGELEVVDSPGRAGGTSVAIILSGDGGWRDLDRSLGEILNADGVHVIGIDCLRYFWSARTPDEAAADLGALIAEVARRTPDAKIALIGYSFGADVLPALYNRLDAEAQARVVLLSLLALGRDAHFEIHMEGWLGGDVKEDAVPTAPDLARIAPGLVQCIYGAEEADESGCRDPALHGAEVIGTPGGHHFDENYQALAQRILSRLRAAG